MSENVKRASPKHVVAVAVIALAAFLLLCRISAAGPPERSQNRQTITVVSDDNYPPYIFRNAQGDLQGILIDEWNLWEEKTGIRVDYRGMDWAKALNFMIEGNADVIDTIFFTEKRAQLLDYSKPYATLEVPIFFHKNISGITDINSLQGFVIGVKDGDACVDMLQRSGISAVNTYHNYEHMVEAAAKRDISVFCMDKPPALYYLYKFNIEKEYRHSPPLYSGQFHRAVKKGRSDLLGVIEGGFSKITDREHQEIEKKWIGTTLNANPAVVRNIAYSLVGIATIALILILWNLMLRKRVASKTVQLQTALAELKKKEEGLILSEKKFSTLFLSSPDSVVITDARDGAFVEINDRFLSFLGYGRDEVIGKTVIGLDIWAVPDDRKVFRRALAEKGLMNSLETSFRTKQGAIVPCLVSGRSIDIEGRPYVISVVTDISRIRQAQEELRRSKRFIETIFNSMHEAIAIVDAADLTIVDANRVFIEQSGLPKAELVGKRCHEITHRSVEPCIAHGEVCPISAMVETRTVCTLEHLHQLKDGGSQYVEVTAAPVFNEKGDIVQAIYMTQDITARKLAEETIRKSEERYRNLFESTLDGVYEVNADGIFTQMNPAGAKIFGYSSPEEMIGTDAVDRWRDVRDREAFRAALKLQKTVSTYHMPSRKKNGEPIELESSSRIIEDQEGNFLGIVGILRDVTERILREIERDKLIQQLRDAIANVRTLSGMLPICASCKKIRDDKGYWSQVETYVSRHTEAVFTSGVCPECEKKMYEELEKLKREKT